LRALACVPRRRRWRVDVVLSTSSVSRVLRPCVLLRTTLTDGSVATFEMNLDAFHELRHSAAEALLAMDTAAPKLAAVHDVALRARGPAGARAGR
jgi:hypothetical protein